MSSVQLRQKLKKQVDNLPADDLRRAAQFIGLLYSASRPNAADLRKIAKMQKATNQAKRDFAAGKGVNWRSVRDDV
jgi:hypothetical protein